MMNSKLIFQGILLLAAAPFIFDNEKDPLSDGFYRVVDERGYIGYADESGEIQIEPQFAMGMPFCNGKALVTYEGIMIEVPGSDGEYHRFEGGSWFYIDKKGNAIESSGKTQEDMN